MSFLLKNTMCLMFFFTSRILKFRFWEVDLCSTSLPSRNWVDSLPLACSIWISLSYFLSFFLSLNNLKFLFTVFIYYFLHLEFRNFDFWKSISALRVFPAETRLTVHLAFHLNLFKVVFTFLLNFLKLFLRFFFKSKNLMFYFASRFLKFRFWKYITALRVFPAETRLTVYRRRSIWISLKLFEFLLKFFFKHVSYFFLVFFLCF